jgi:hypothetical protein
MRPMIILVSLMKGFYRANKTDILFTKLKNHRLQDRDETYVGEVIDVLKGEALVLDLKKEITNWHTASTYFH